MSNGPFEDLGDEHVITYPCPDCDTMHDRTSYVDTGRTVDRDGIRYRIYRCPNGHEVIIDMTGKLPANPADPIVVELDPKK